MDDLEENRINDYTVLRTPKKSESKAEQVYSYNEMKSEASMHHEHAEQTKPNAEAEAQYKAAYWKARYEAFMKEMGEDLMVSPTSVTAPNVSGYGWGGNFGANLVGVNPGDAALILSGQLASLQLSNQGILAYQGANALYMSQCFAQNSKDNAMFTKDVHREIAELKADLRKDRIDDMKDNQTNVLLQMILNKLNTPTSGD